MRRNQQGVEIMKSLFGALFLVLSMSLSHANTLGVGGLSLLSTNPKEQGSLLFKLLGVTNSFEHEGAWYGSFSDVGGNDVHIGFKPSQNVSSDSVTFRVKDLAHVKSVLDEEKLKYEELSVPYGKFIVFEDRYKKSWAFWQNP
jgi:hypothetical protein